MTTHKKVVVPPEELELILIAQQREIIWWEDYSTMYMVDDITACPGTARLPRDRQAVHSTSLKPLYKVSANIHDCMRVLRLSAFRVLESIACSWYQEMLERSIYCDDLFLVITSLARTPANQAKLIEMGYPAAPNDSTHCKLGAFDIGVKWFFDNNRRDALYALDTVLTDLHLADEINWIYEQSIGVYHIAANPNLKE